MSDSTKIWIALTLGMIAGAGLAIGARRKAATAAVSVEKPSCARKIESAACPLHGDPQAELQFRRTLRDGIFLPWVELGRAPTPAEFAKRLGLPDDKAASALAELQACGESEEAGILRVPGSDLVAVAWPFANVPTGITVTVDGGRPVQARCAIDALGVSQMLGRRATVEAEARDDGSHLKVVVDGAQLINSTPAGIAVVKGIGCDNMSFFSSRNAAESWRAAHGGEGELMSIEEAVARGAKIFGGLTAGL
jgi:hypothetical protein